MIDGGKIVWHPARIHVSCISSLHADCLTKCVKQFRLGIAINRRFECSVFSVQDAEDVIAQVVCQLIGAILLGCEVIGIQDGLSFLNSEH